MKRDGLSKLINDEITTAALTKLYRVHVEYPAFDEHLDAIERCRTMTALSGRPHCIAILGESGVGKSHLAERLKKLHPDREESDRLVRPILVVEVPKHATIKGLLGEMLVSLGCKESLSLNRTSLLRSLIRLLDELKVDTIVIDEGQHMQNRNSSDGDVADWLKTLINRSGRTVVLMGTPTTERLLAASEYQQTTSRFQRIRFIYPFSWEGKGGGKTFRKFLQHIDGALPFPESSNLADPEVAIRLFCATRGYLRMLFRIVTAATVDGLATGARHLSIDLLDQAMRLEVNERIPLHAHAFTASVTDVMRAVIGDWTPMHEPPKSNRPGKQATAKTAASMLVK